VDCEAGISSMRRRHAAAALDDVPEPDRNRNGSARSFSSGNPIQQCDGNGILQGSDTNRGLLKLMDVNEKEK